MRLAAALFVAAHGIGYVIWFMNAWTPAALGRRPEDPTAPPGTAPPGTAPPGTAPPGTGRPGIAATGRLGKALGLLSLAVVVGFLAAAWGIWEQAAWWPAVLLASAVASFPVALSVWSPVGIVSVPATLASVALIAATLMPWGDRFLGPH
jgi:hypothetical protein